MAVSVLPKIIILPSRTRGARVRLRYALLRLAAAAALAGLAGSAGAVQPGDASVDPATHVVHLTSLEWPPYTGADLPATGATTAVVRAALAAVGYKLDVRFYPWSRAVALARGQPRYVGYFPEYDSPAVRRDFLLTDPIGSGPLGLVERIDAPVHWTVLADLSRYTIGVVQDYVNTEAFDARVRAGLQPVSVAVDDKHNLLKVAAGRVPLAVVDRRVFEYVTRHDAQTGRVAPELHFNERLLEDKQLYICLRRTPEGEQVRQLINTGLRRIDAAAVMAAALR